MLNRAGSVAGPISVAILLGLVGCGEQDTPKDPEPVSIERIGDTTVVITRRPSPLDTARLVRVATIGRFDGPEDFLIVSLEAFAVGWRGEVYVADQGIRVFSPDGSEVRRFARTGQGPGEVGRVSDLEVDESGRLLAVDISNRRVAVFDTSGAVLDHWRLPPGRPGYGRSALVPVPGKETLLELDLPIDPLGGPQHFPRPIYLRLDSMGTVLDTVFSPARFTEPCLLLDDPYFSNWASTDVREVVFPKVKWTAGRSGDVVVGCPAEYEIDRIRPDGTVMRIAHSREPLVEPPEARKSFPEQTETSFRGSGRDWSWKGPAPPEQKPYYHRLVVGRGGRLWVWPGHPRVPWQSPDLRGKVFWVDPTTGTFDVFETDGRFLGQVMLPEGVVYQWFLPYEEPFFSGDTVWLPRQDSLNVRYIDRMLIEW